MKSIAVATFVGLLLIAVAGRDLRQVSISATAVAQSTGGGVASAVVDTSASPALMVASEAPVSTEPAPPRLLDVYFLVDLTETSTSFIAELAQDASIIVNESFAVTETVYLGVGTYQDTPDASSFTNLVNVSGALNLTESTLSRCASDEKVHNE